MLIVITVNKELIWDEARGVVSFGARSHEITRDHTRSFEARGVVSFSTTLYRARHAPIDAARLV